MDWCKADDGMGGGVWFYRDTEGNVDVATVLHTGCTIYASAHSNTTRRAVFTVCEPRLPDPNVGAYGSSGGSYYIDGTIVTYNVATGQVLSVSTGGWSLATCGCWGGASLGNDGACYCRGTLYWDDDQRACVVRPPDPTVIALVGPTQTKALPAGPALPFVATVTRGGLPVVGISVSIAGTAGSTGGVTDASGSFRFTYIPPVQREAEAIITASCSGCANTAQKEVSVAHCEVCDRTFGNPIQPATGEKLQDEVDWLDAAPHPLSLIRHYRSQGNAQAGLGASWSHNFAAQLLAANGRITVRLADGEVVRFTESAGAWTPDSGIDQLLVLPTGYVFVHARSERRYSFDAAGVLQSIAQRNGWTMTLTYAESGRLARVTNAFGRSLHFTYDAAGRLASVATPEGRMLAYGYDTAAHLASVTYPDGKTRGYHYEDTRWPQALTGVTDEAGVRAATFSYDALGRAVGTEHAAGTAHYSVSYDSGAPATPSGTLQAGTVVDPQIYRLTIDVSTPAGAVQRHVWMGGNGRMRRLSASSPAEGEMVAARSLDASGLPTVEEDFLGVRSEHIWDASRQLKLSTTRAAGHPEQQTTQTQWHPTFRLPVLVSEAGRTAAYVYDSNGNKTRETVTDLTTGRSRTWAWSYTDSGLIETMTEPNGAVWGYSYDSQGNRVSEANPLGYITTFTYDTAGRIRSRTAPTSLVTTYTYDARGRVLTQTQGGLRTTFTYTPTGQLASVTLPSGLALRYTYDDAQRLVAWTSNRGDKVSYTLDAAGNRTQEQIKDSTGTVVWQLTRTVNAINLLSSQTVGTSQSQTFGYDANGELFSQTNALGQTTHWGLDSLRRITSINEPTGAQAQLTYNALDALIAASDYKGATTSYSRDALGETRTEISPDSGTRQSEHDALGLPSRIIDALGQATRIQRDALGRPTRLDYGDGSTTTLRYDLSGDDYNAPGAPDASRGYLSEINDKSGTTRWQRDILGRVTRKVQTLMSGGTQQTSYTYNLQGLLDTLTYPGGGQLRYSYNDAGELVSLSWNGTVLIQDIHWNATGLPTGWTWAFAAPLQASRSYDTAGRMTESEVASYQRDTAGRITAIGQSLAVPMRPGGTQVVTVPFEVGYDAVGRITEFVEGQAAKETFSYDANGNRLKSVLQQGNNTVIKTYSIDAQSNRLLGFTQQTSGLDGTATTTVTYGYNANGDIVSDGLRQFGYDAQGRLVLATSGATETAAMTRYAYNALGQRVFKTEPQSLAQAQAQKEQGLWDKLAGYFRDLGMPSQPEPGWAYAYDEDGTLMGEYGMGETASTGSTQYIWLPTPNGPMPIATIINGARYAVQADHLNTPRRLTNEQGKIVWQWKYSAFGDEQPTTAVTSFNQFSFNLRYPGQYADQESGLSYNYSRNYSPSIGRYTQPDPIGLEGGWNRFSYADADPLSFVDPLGLAKGPEPTFDPTSKPTPEPLWKRFFKDEDFEACAKSQPLYELCKSCCVSTPFKNPNNKTHCMIKCTDQWKVTSCEAGDASP